MLTDLLSIEVQMWLNMKANETDKTVHIKYIS